MTPQPQPTAAAPETLLASADMPTQAQIVDEIAARHAELAAASGSLLLARPTTATAGDLRELLADAPADATVTIRTPTLDDVFLELTKEVTA